MELLTRLVSESLARYGFDRPVDYRRLRWSRWFRCESLHSLLFVPSQPGVFATAEEIVDFGTRPGGTTENGPAFQRPEDRGNEEPRAGGTPETASNRASAPVASRRMLAVTHFFEDDDMAFVLDRMLSRQNPMRDRLLSGRYFIRYVVIEDAAQRRSIASALNQWIANSTEKAGGIGAHFASSLEITETRVGAEAFLRPARAASMKEDGVEASPAPRSPFPSGF